MNLITETKRRLNYLNNELDGLKKCLDNCTVSLIAKQHLNSEISKTEQNIQYYSEILEKLEAK